MNRVATAMVAGLVWILPATADSKKEPVVESLQIKVETDSKMSPHSTVFKMKLKLRNPTDQNRVYQANMVFKDSEGFFVFENGFLPNKHSRGNPCFTVSHGFSNVECNMAVKAGQTREFLSNMELPRFAADKVDLDKSKLEFRSTVAKDQQHGE